MAPDQQSPQRLVEFLTAVSRHEYSDQAIRAAAELAAEEFDAEIGAVLIGDELGAVFGFGTTPIPAATLRGLRPGSGQTAMGLTEPCQWAAAAWETDEPGRLLVARFGESFAPAERNLLLWMARGLGLALRMIGVLAHERERTEVLEVLLQIQRSISRHAPLPQILSAVSRGASSLLGDLPVSLVLDDELDPQRPIIAGAELPANASTFSAPVHVDGTPAGALIAAATGAPFVDAEQRLLATFAEHASLALTDAHTVEAMQEAFHDPLTGLPNRALFLDRVHHALTLARRQDHPASVLFIDLDGFKKVNDTIGHAAGDQLLRGVARRILSCTRSADTAARFGGDEFAVLLEAIESVDEADQVADRIIAAVRRPFRIQGNVVFVGATVGIGHADGTSTDPDVLLRNADLAMYRAKHGGRGRWTTFEPSMREAMIKRTQLETDVRHALDRGELSVAYQPLFDLESRQPIAVEALLRWTHARDGFIDPTLFIPIAEQTGAIVDIGRWLLDQACQYLADWRDIVPRLTLHINVAAQQLYSDALQDHLTEALGAVRLPWQAITIEVTETTLSADRGEMPQQLERLKRLGARIALDNFGTGPSSLRRLREIPIDMLKIDPSLTRHTDRGGGDALVRAIVALSHAMGLKAIAEGIETAAQLSALQETGCHIGQGAQLSPLQNAQTLTDFFRDHTATTQPSPCRENTASPTVPTNRASAFARRTVAATSDLTPDDRIADHISPGD